MKLTSLAYCGLVLVVSATVSLDGRYVAGVALYENPPIRAKE
jgi:hypothetical protein